MRMEGWKDGCLIYKVEFCKAVGKSEVGVSSKYVVGKGEQACKTV